MLIARSPVGRSFEYYRDLIVEIVKVELKTRHFQNLLGPLWWLLDPVLNALMFFFLTTVLFQAGSGVPYLLFILTMTISWRWFSKSVNNAPTGLLTYQGVLRRTNFPPLVIPFASAAVELVFFMFGFVVLIAALLLGGVVPNWTWVALPLIVFVQLVLTLALSTFLSVVGLFLRDLSQVMWLVTGLWFYMSPAIYPIDRVPERFRWLYDLNPFATLMPAYKDVLIDGKIPDVERLVMWLGISSVLLILALEFFRRLRGRFYKVL